MCREDKRGRGYIGRVNTTISGLECQHWSSNTPHVPGHFVKDDAFPDWSVEAAENYCRNPDPDWQSGVWCYTMDPNVRFEECDVPECGWSLSVV